MFTCSEHFNVFQVSALLQKLALQIRDVGLRKLPKGLRHTKMKPQFQYESAKCQGSPTKFGHLTFLLVER